MDGASYCTSVSFNSPACEIINYCVQFKWYDKRNSALLENTVLFFSHFQLPRSLLPWHWFSTRYTLNGSKAVLITSSPLGTWLNVSPLLPWSSKSSEPKAWREWWNCCKYWQKILPPVSAVVLRQAYPVSYDLEPTGNVLVWMIHVAWWIQPWVCFRLCTKL